MEENLVENMAFMADWTRSLYRHCSRQYHLNNKSIKVRGGRFCHSPYLWKQFRTIVEAYEVMKRNLFELVAIVDAVKGCLQAFTSNCRIDNIVLVIQR
jgi:hypothetical protein